MALVHSLLLSRGCFKYIRPHLPVLLSRTQAPWGIGLTVTLYLIGTGLSMKTLREVGVRPFLQGILLWILVAVGSLTLIRGGWIHL